MRFQCYWYPHSWQGFFLTCNFFPRLQCIFAHYGTWLDWTKGSWLRKTSLAVNVILHNILLQFSTRRDRWIEKVPTLYKFITHAAHQRQSKNWQILHGAFRETYSLIYHKEINFWWGLDWEFNFRQNENNWHHGCPFWHFPIQVIMDNLGFL